MNTSFLYGILLTSLSMSMTGCSDDKDLFFENLQSDETLEVVHPNEWDKPYPREEHELYLNPVSMIAPRSVKGKEEFLEFEVSQDMNFSGESTFRSGKVSWNIYNIHKEMPVGEWYWRFRKISQENQAGAWSEVNKFTVTGKEDVFVTPAFSEFLKNMPAGYPRIHCYLDKDLPTAREKVESSPEYASFMGRVRTALEYMPTTDLYADNKKVEALRTNVEYTLYTAHMLLQDTKYQDKILEIARTLLYVDISSMENLSEAAVISAWSHIYDACYERLTGEERERIEDILMTFISKHYNSFKGRLECQFFDNHVWQHILRAITQATLVIHQKYPVALEALEYCYEVWSTRAPDAGLNRFGAWINGVGYFDVNTQSLCYMPLLFSHLTGADFLQHPWYKTAGKAMMYSWLPDSGHAGFGDNNSTVLLYSPTRQRVAFADFIAREVKDSYAAWYVKECGNTVYDDTSLRLYRMARWHISYGSPELSGDKLDNFVWYKDTGEGVAYSSLSDRSKNMALAFRSSPFGSGSHTLADQNSFKLLYKGRYVYLNAGYYQNFSDKHNILQYRHTRGHNSILVNGIGQPFTPKAYGNINRALNGENLAYFMGDASHAYCGISDLTVWTNNFKNAGLSQTPEYGFGKTPLNNYKRHIFMLRPNKVVIYDDLGADEPATWQWLLHSLTEFHIVGNKVTTEYETDKGNFTSVAQIFSEQAPGIETTNKWYPGGEPTDQDPVKYPKQWHLTATFGPSMNNKILTVIQLGDDSKQIEDIWQVNNNFIVGDWNIQAEMGANNAAAITITNKVTGTVFSYNEEMVINGATYQRGQEGSSVLYDNVGGTMQVQEMSDKPLQSTRAVSK
ncbi:DUF4962 domain-containing protein [Bacteroides sp.]|uniref:DUF4962 domain-containing protein n=1 Tax=Bacteroides sp. TaxID=29523 RepID=UPI00402923EF